MQMICPKANECKDGKMEAYNEKHCHRRCIPHPKQSLCGGSNYHGFCPPCIPYVRELKGGNKVRVLGRTVNCENTLLYKSLDILGIPKNSIHKISIPIKKHCSCGSLLFNISSGGTLWAFHEEDLELITEGDDMPDKPKYKWTGKKLYLIDIAKEATAIEFKSFIENYFNRAHKHSLKTIATGIEVYVTDRLIKYAEKDAIRNECFIKCLIDKGYIEEVQSEYGKWEKVIEWAKRMPREE